MIFKKLNLKNFMNVAEANLTFQEGYNILYGQNGEGKSTVFCGIAFPLTGYTRGNTWQEYIKTGEDGFNIEMSIQMSDNPSDLMEFEYSGYISDSTVSKKVFYNGVSYTNSKANEFLASAFDLDMMRNIIFSLQGSKTLSDLTPSEIRDIFKKIFNSDFPDILEKIKLDQTAYQVEGIRTQANLDTFKAKSYNLLPIEPVDNTAMTTLKLELESSKGDELFRQKHREYTEKLSQTQSKQNQISEVLSKKETRLKNIKGFQESILTLKEGVILSEDKITKAEELVAIETLKLTSLKEDFRLMEIEIDSSIMNISKNRDEFIANNPLEPLNEVITQLKTKEAEKTADIAILSKHILSHQKGICDACGQKTSVTMAHTMEEERNTLQLDLVAIKGSITECQTTIRNIELKKQEFISLLSTQNNTNSLIRASAVQKLTLQERLLDSKNNEVALAKKEPETILAKINIIESQQIPSEVKAVEDLDKELINISSEVESLTKWCNENKVDISGLTSRSAIQIQREIDSFLEQIQVNIQNQTLNEKLLKDKESDQNSIQELNLCLNDLALKSKNLKTIQKIYDTEFPNFINARACILLQDYMNDFMSSTKDGFNVNISLEKKGVAFSYKARNEPEWKSIKMCSGFEGALVTAGYKICIAKAFGSDFIFLDEVDGPASEESSERLFQNISDMSFFKQVFIITHKVTPLEIFKERQALIYKVEKGTFESLYN